MDESKEIDEAHTQSFHNVDNDVDGIGIDARTKGMIQNFGLDEKTFKENLIEPQQDEMVRTLYNIGIVWARKKKITPTSVMVFISLLMKNAENLVVRDHDGVHKEKAVVTVLYLILNDDKIAKYNNESEKEEIMLLVQHWAPGIIEFAVKAIHDPMGTIGKISHAFQSYCIPPTQRKPKH